MNKIIKTIIAAGLFLIASPALAQRHTPSTFNYYSISNPNATQTFITGINNRGKITGYDLPIGVASSLRVFKAFTSEPPYARFSDISYPGSVSSQAMALSNTFSQAGEYSDTTGHVYGYIRTHLVPVQYPNPILGINRILCGGKNCHGTKYPGNLLAVGPINGAGYVLDTVTQTVGNFQYPATGINGKGHVIGNYPGGVWLYTNGAVRNLPIALNNVSAQGLNWQDNIVGNYTGTDNIQHGFVFYPHVPVITLNYPGATCGTWATSINDHDYIVGYYCNSQGIHGFLAVPSN